jgi:hypothetical protein
LAVEGSRSNRLTPSMLPACMEAMQAQNPRRHCLEGGCRWLWGGFRVPLGSHYPPSALPIRSQSGGSWVALGAGAAGGGSPAGTVETLPGWAGVPVEAFRTQTSRMREKK